MELIDRPHFGVIRPYFMEYEAENEQIETVLAKIPLPFGVSLIDTGKSTSGTDENRQEKGEVM